MHQKLGFVGIVAIGCLVTAPGLTGCSAPANNNNNNNNNNSGGDAGPADSGPQNSNDAGPGGNDAGPAADAGPDIGVGAVCANSMTQTAGECASGLMCIALSATTNICSNTSCMTNADCGMNGTIQNFCDTSAGICLRGCSSSATNSCGSTDFICVSNGVGQPEVCIPDCTKQNADYCTLSFGYPNVCDSMGDADQGLCVIASGGSCTTGAGGTACATAGTECYNVPAAQTGGMAETSCVPDCTVASTQTCTSSTATACASGACGGTGTCATCPQGYTCDTAATHTCLPVPAAFGEPCTTSLQCPTTTGSECVDFGFGGICTATCTGTGATPCAANMVASGITAPTCLSAGSQSFCIIGCTAGATAKCPTGATCESTNAGGLCL